MMKKLVLLATVFMASATAFAQREVGSLTILPKVGLNIANLTDTDDADPRLGLAFGAEFEYQFTNKFSLSAGALYSMQGAKSSTNEDGVNAKMTAKMDYINIPILANVYVADGLAVKVGIQPGFNVSSKYKVSAQGMDVSGSLSDMDIDIKALDFSIPIGVSYEIDNFVIDGRYNLGVTKVADDADSKNSVFQFPVGYRFDL